MLVVLDEHLGTEAAVDAGAEDVLVVAVEDMAGAEAERGKARVDVLEVERRRVRELAGRRRGTQSD